MKRFPWVIIFILVTVISSMLPLAFPDAAQAGAGESPLEELTNGSDSVIVGTVVEHSSYWDDEHTGIYTSVVLSVGEKLKGTASQDRITVTLLGGEVDGIGEWVSDMPSFDQGEKAVVFLKKLSEAQLPQVKVSQEQLSKEQFEVYGGFKGKFAIKQGKVNNLTVAEFKERVRKVVQGQIASTEDLDVSSTPVISLYSYSGMKWPGSSPAVNYRINENCVDCTGEGAAVKAAAATWSAAGAKFSFSYGGTTTAKAYGYDGVNQILWKNLGAVTTIARAITWSSGNTILECDMEFNDYYTFNTASTPPSGQYDTQSIALHEFGHFLRLLDLYGDADAAKVMYGYGATGTTKRTLHADDIAGIRHIYGASAVPEAPSGLTATAVSSTRIDLSWTDNSDDETGFKIERKTGATAYAQIAAVGAGVTSYSSTGLRVSTTYSYRVRAYNTGGNSDYSEEASAKTLPLPPPAPRLKSPTNKATAYRLTPSLVWNASTGASDYSLQVATDTGFTTLVVDETDIADTYYDVTSGLEWNKTYYWRANARNSSGSPSRWSAVWYFKTAAGPPPNAPSGLTATAVASTQIDLSWTDNSTDEAGFKIERLKGTKYVQIATVGTDNTSYSNTTGLKASTKYYYRVRAYNTGGNSDYSEAASAKTLPPPPPAPRLKAPKNNSTTDNLTPRLEWYVSKGAADYSLQVATDAAFTTPLIDETIIAPDTHYDVTSALNPNTKYYWRVNARNSSGSPSKWSIKWYFMTP